MLSVDFSSTFALGNFFVKAAIKIPMYVGVEAIQNPQYNPLDPDITLKSSLDELQSNNEKEELKDIAQDLTKESLLTLQMSENKSNSSNNKSKIYDIENRQ